MPTGQAWQLLLLPLPTISCPAKQQAHVSTVRFLSQQDSRHPGTVTPTLEQPLREPGRLALRPNCASAAVHALYCIGRVERLLGGVRATGPSTGDGLRRSARAALLAGAACDA